MFKNQELLTHCWSVHPNISRQLDLLRWLAAVLVLISHIKSLFFVDYSEIYHPHLLVTAVYFIASLGHQAVIVFFVLSGLFISGSVTRSMLEGKWSWKSYAINRLTRLYIVLIPALFIGLFWDYMGFHLFRDTGVYEGIPQDHYILPFSSSKHLSLSILGGNLLFLQGIFFPTFGSNSPLWSLSYEFWYYLLFPLLISIFLASTNQKKLRYSLLTVLLMFFIGKTISMYFLIWLLGWFIVAIPPKILVKKNRYLLSIGAVLMFGSLLVDRILPSAGDFIVAVLFSFYLYLRNAMPEDHWKTDKLYFAKSLSGFSYTLYLVHFPLLVFMHAAYFHTHRGKWLPDPLHILIGIGITAIVVLYAWGIAFFTERKTAELRGWVIRLFNRKNTIVEKPSIDMQ